MPAFREAQLDVEQIAGQARNRPPCTPASAGNATLEALACFGPTNRGRYNFSEGWTADGEGGQSAWRTEAEAGGMRRDRVRWPVEVSLAACPVCSG